MAHQSEGLQSARSALTDSSDRLLDLLRLQDLYQRPDLSFPATLRQCTLDDLRAMAKALPQAAQRNLAKALKMPGGVLPPPDGFDIVRSRLEAAANSKDFSPLMILGEGDLTKLMGLLPEGIESAASAELIRAIRSAETELLAAVGRSRLAFAMCVLSVRRVAPWPLMAINTGLDPAITDGEPLVSDVASAEETLRNFVSAAEEAMTAVRQLVVPLTRQQVPANSAELELQIGTLHHLLRPLARVAGMFARSVTGAGDEGALDLPRTVSVSSVLDGAVSRLRELVNPAPPALEGEGGVGHVLEHLRDSARSGSKVAWTALQALSVLVIAVAQGASDVDVDGAAEAAKTALGLVDLSESGTTPGSITMAAIRGHIRVTTEQRADGESRRLHEDPAEILNNTGGSESSLTAQPGETNAAEGPDLKKPQLEAATALDSGPEQPEVAPFEVERAADEDLRAPNTGEMRNSDVDSTSASTDGCSDEPDARRFTGVASTEAIAGAVVPRPEQAVATAALSTEQTGLLGAAIDPRIFEIEAASAGQHRHALAGHAAKLAGKEARANLHFSLCLSEHVTAGTGELASVAARLLVSGRDHLNDDRTNQLLAMAAALRLSVYAPGPEVIETLTNLHASLVNAVEVHEFLGHVLQICRSGINLSAESAALRQVSEIEDALVAARRRADEALRTGSSRTNKYTAATIVWANWIRPTGLLGDLLSAAAKDDRARLGEVRATVERLRDSRAILAEMHKADRRATKRNEITAGAKQRLVDWCQEVLDDVSAWIVAADSSDVANRVGIVGGGLGEGLQEFLRSKTPQILNEIDGHDHSKLLAAVAHSVGRSIAITIELMRVGAPPPAQEPSPEALLNDGLLLAVRLCAHPEGGFDGSPSIEDLEAVLGSDENTAEAWENAYHRRAAAGDHVATRRIVRVLEQLNSERGDLIASQRAAAVEVSATKHSLACRAVGDELASARSHGHLDDAQWSTLSGALEALITGQREDFGRMESALGSIRNGLESARITTQRNVVARLGDLTNQRTIEAPARARIGGLIDKGDFATADEYIALLRDGLPLPEAPTPHQAPDDWWPDAVERLSQATLDSKFARMVRDGQTTAVLDFSGLDERAREEAGDGVQAWIDLAVAGQPAHVRLEAVRPILRLLGIEASGFSGGVGKKKHSEYAHYQLSGFRPTGRALVPDFGSQSSGDGAGGSAAVMVVWGQPRVATVAAWISDESTPWPLHLWYCGHLDPIDRVALADRLRERRHRRPITIVDDTVIAYLASTAGRDYETTMRLTLPFAACNPYQAVGGLTPPEMFYGRDAERQALRDMMGSALVYGGRQLGKSSLLRATQRDFDNGTNRRAIYLDVRADQIGGVRPPSEIWYRLWRSLADIAVVHGEPPESRLSERLQAETIKWLDGRPDRAILFLLDECDTFLMSDAASDFDTVDALDNFMAEAKRRIKFVFAGLHRVQRFSSVENHPLAHLGNPIAVGPLRAIDAMKLVVRPTEALGYTFEHDELPARILAFCNNNPSLLVLFMQALVARKLDEKLQRPGAVRPPVVITDADVEETYTKESLADQIKERFDLTLELDPAYKVIAYTVAHEASERGPGTELSVRYLRDTTASWWPRGFAGITNDAFRSLCDELVDLGVFSRRGGNYALRSPNILRFLGSADQIAEVLVDAEQREPTATFDALTARPRLGSDPNRRSPLAAAQLNDLVAPRHQIRLVVGTTASGLDDAVEAIRAAALSRATVESPDARSTKLTSYKNSTPRHRVVAVDLRQVDVHRARTLLQDARARRQHDLGTLGIVFLTDIRHRDLLHEVLSEERWSSINLVEIGRVSGAAWKQWVADAEILHNADELLERTGGWLRLLSSAAAAGLGSVPAPEREKLLVELRTRADDLLWSADLVSQVRLEGPLAAAFSAICDGYPDGGDLDTIQTWVELHNEDPKSARLDVELLKVIGALVPYGEQLVPEPVLKRAFLATHLR